MITVRNLSRTYADGTEALRDITLEIPAGVIVGLVGRNGAGKTTLLKCLMGLLNPSRGEVRIFGHDLRFAPAAIREQVTYVSQMQRLPEERRLVDLWELYGPLYSNWDRAFAEHAADLFEIHPESYIGGLSGGEQRLAALTLAFAARPKLLLLDEPAAGLDPIARRRLLSALATLIAEQPGLSVILSTHLLADLERLADTLIFLDNGQLSRVTTMDDLRSRYRRLQLIFGADGIPPGFRVPGTLRRDESGPVLTLLVEDIDDFYLDNLKSRPDLRVIEHPLSLEDLFIELEEAR